MAGETADHGLPRTLRSPWRWVGLAVGVTLVLTGTSGFVVGIVDPVDLVVSCVLVALGGVATVLSWRSGVVVSERYVEERGMSGWSMRMAWTDVAEVRTVEGTSMLPSRAIELVGRNGVDVVILASLSWYAFRAHKVPTRVAEFKRIASALIGSVPDGSDRGGADGVAMTGASEESVKRIVREVTERVADLRVSVTPALEVEDVSLIEFWHPDFTEVELVVATDAHFVKALVGRYVFDFVPVSDIGEFMRVLFSGQARLRNTLFRGGYLLFVDTAVDTYEVHGSKGYLPLEDWEAAILDKGR